MLPRAYVLWYYRRMAVDLVQSALVCVLSRPECQIKTDRSRLVKSNYERVTAALSKHR